LETYRFAGYKIPDSRRSIGGYDFHLSRGLLSNNRSFVIALQTLAKRDRGCGLTEMKICPKQAGNQLTFQEVQKMKNLVTATEYGHFPIRSLHYFAKREKILFCSYSTWRKYIDQYGWKRPRKKPRAKMIRIGLRAKRPNEIWHLD